MQQVASWAAQEVTRALRAPATAHQAHKEPHSTFSGCKQTAHGGLSGTVRRLLPVQCRTASSRQSECSSGQAKPGVTLALAIKAHVCSQHSVQGSLIHHHAKEEG